ncbi:DUF6339 family protein [Planctomycetota bacterium]|nr:DUF6339 family protein [Planctomycetota bacterium]
MNGYVYPRLPDSVAKQEYENLVEEYKRNGGDPGKIRGTVKHHTLASYDPTGAKVPKDVLEKLRNRVMDAAVARGFPHPLPTSAITPFDHEVAGLVYEFSKMVPGETGHSGVWNHMALVLLPDVTVWRWPNLTANRFFDTGGGKNLRNYFQLSWFRAWLFYDESHEVDRIHLLRCLNQDAMLQIMERPGLSRNRKLARVLARFYGKHRGMVENFDREYFRPLLARILTIGTFIGFDFLREDQLQSFVEEQWDFFKPEENAESGSGDPKPEGGTSEARFDRSDVENGSPTPPDDQLEASSSSTITLVAERVEEATPVSCAPAGYESHEFWGPFYDEGAPVFPELRRCAPTRDGKKIGPYLHSGIQVDVTTGSRGEAIRLLNHAFIRDRADFERFIGERAIGRQVTYNDLGSVTIRNGTPQEQLSWTMADRAEKTLELYRNLKDYFRPQ